MKFNKNKFKANLNHIWTFHKLSSLIYVASLGVFSLLIYLGGQIIKLKIVLPDYLLSGLVVILLGFMLFSIYNRMANFIEDDETANKKHPSVSGNLSKGEKE